MSPDPPGTQLFHGTTIDTEDAGFDVATMMFSQLIHELVPLENLLFSSSSCRSIRRKRYRLKKKKKKHTESVKTKMEE